MSTRISFNDNWYFHEGEIDTPVIPAKGPSYTQAKTERYLGGPASRNFPDVPDEFPDAAATREITLLPFRRVDLPHDYIVTQVPQADRNSAWGFYDYHPAWYRKHFVIGSEDKDKRIVLYFEGIADHATVYFNGVYMYDNYEAHTPFEVDLTDFIRFDDDNVLAIHVECGTGEGWWYQGGGIYRNVWLEKSAPVSVARYGVYVHPEKQNDGTWLVPIETEVRNDCYENVTCTVETEISESSASEDPAKPVKTFAGSLEISLRESATLHQELTVIEPALWDIDTPNLYEAVTTIRVDGEVTDVQRTTFGFREIAFDAKNGFFLNGRNVKLQGVCCHGDYGLTGLAVENSVYRHKARLLKEMGVNAYRCSHYPQAEYWMDQMDRQGIVVMNETRWFSTVPKCMKEMETLIKRDRNHPSVIMWSVGNEEPFFITEQGARIARSLYAAAKKLDSTRPILTANDRDPEIATVYEYSDIVGVNYHMELFDKLHTQYPDMPIFSTENSASGTSRGWYHNDVPAIGRISAYDHDVNDYFRAREYTWQYIYDRPWLMGGMQWTGFEYRGEAVWPRICSVSGAIDLYLQKKDAFYQNQSFWVKEPMIHVLPHWNHPGEEGRLIKVYAYTNCEEAELFVNGVSAGKQALKPVQHAEWDVTYEPGVIEVIGYVNGKEAARDRHETTGAAYALKLTADNADDVAVGELLLLTCTAIDEAGREVPDAEINDIRFYGSKNAPVVGTGSDNTDHVPPRESIRRMYAGRVSVAVRVMNDSPMEIRAEASGLRPAIYTWGVNGYSE